MALLLLVAAAIVSADTPLDLQRCAEAKAKNPAALTIVSIVLSLATEFDRRSELRQTQFKDAISLAGRTVFRPSGMPKGSTSTPVQDDKRPVCVQPIFVLSAWYELKREDWRSKAVRKDEWYQITAESNLHRDMLLAPTVIDPRSRAKVLMHVLEWCRQRTPWADYTMSMDINMHIHWAQMIELFPPVVPHKHSGYALWHLGGSEPGMDALFAKDPRDGSLRQCANVGVSAFSRDLVREITRMTFATQMLYALRHPFQMHRSRCTLGRLCRS